jgi:hypothetical protein
MRKTKLFLVGLFILCGGIASAQSNDSILNSYFLHRALRVDHVKSIIYNGNGDDLKPICIYCPSRKIKNLDSDKTWVHVENLSFTRDGDVVDAALVFHIDGEYEVITNFISNDYKEWKELDTTIRHLNSGKI